MALDSMAGRGRSDVRWAGMRRGSPLGIALVSFMCSQVAVTQEDDFLFPVEFGMYVSNESPLRPYAPPHPCGSVLTLRSSRIPVVGLSDFRVLWAYELAQNGQVLARWPLPVDAVPVGTDGDRLIIRQALYENVVVVTQGSEIGVPADGLPPFNYSEPYRRMVACPLSSGPSEVHPGYICAAFDEQQTGASRTIAFPPVCT